MREIMGGRVRVGVVGTGSFGRLHAEKYAANERVDLVGIYDANVPSAADVGEALSVPIFDSHLALAEKVDALSVTCSTSAHFSIALDLLTAGKHVLVEKPMTTTVEEADALIAEADRKGVFLQVGHIERFSPAFKMIAAQVSRPLLFEANRIAPYNPRGADVGVVLDLMIHDLDLMLALIDQPLDSVDAIGAPVISVDEDIVNAKFHFANGCTGNLTASRVSYKTERIIRIFEKEVYIQANLADKKLVVMRKGSGEMSPGIPLITREEHDLETVDALADEIAAFVNSVGDRTPPLVDGRAGRDALAAALAVRNSIDAHLRKITESGLI
jgi:predicted dehydrogenase